MKYKYAEIGQRIKAKRKELSLTQDSFQAMVQNKVNYEDKQIDIPRNVIVAVEKGEVYGNNKTFLPSKTLQVIAERLKVPQAEIVFGNPTERIAFIRQLFYQCATNIHPEFLKHSDGRWLTQVIPILTKDFDTDELKKWERLSSSRKLTAAEEATRQKIENGHFMNAVSMARTFFLKSPYFHRELNSCTKAIQEAMLWFSPLALVMRTVVIDNQEYYHYDKDLLDDDDIFDYYLPGQGNKRDDADMYFTYFAHVKLLWEISAKNLIYSFESKVVSDENNINFSKLDAAISQWLKNDFVEIMKKVRKKLDKIELFKFGYQVYDLIRPIIKARENNESINISSPQIIDLEYRPKIWINRQMNPNFFKDAQTLSGDLDLSLLHSEAHDQALTQEHTEKRWDEAVIKEKITKPNLYDRHYEDIFDRYETQGKYLVIPKLLSNQKLVSEGIKHTSNLLYAQILTNMQAKYLTVMDMDEFREYFEVDIDKI